jgi:hypothetical protein
MLPPQYFRLLNLELSEKYHFSKIFHLTHSVEKSRIKSYFYWIFKFNELLLCHFIKLNYSLKNFKIK